MCAAAQCQWRHLHANRFDGQQCLGHTTHDLDLVIQLPPRQIPTLVAAFTNPDYYIAEESVRAAYQPPHQFNVIHVPSALKADFWLLGAVPFEREMFGRRIKDVWFGETIWLATAEDVILHKLYWNRITPSDRQLGDVTGVIHVQRGELDETCLRHWGAELGLASELENALSGALKPKHT